MNRSGFAFTSLNLILFAVSLLSSGCGHDRKVDAKTSDPGRVEIEEVPDVNVVEVQRPEQFPLVAVEQRQSVDQLKVTGAVAPDVSRTVPVVSLSGGRVMEILARLGDDVNKGQPLLRITSGELAAAFSDYQKFQADELLARRQLERSQLLYSREALALKDLQVAEDAQQKAKVDLGTASQRIRILGADLNDPSPVIEVRAPISGTIIEQNVTAGTGVKSLDNSPNLFVVADLSRVWVLCDVYENNLSQVHLGDTAEVRLNAYPDRPLRGKVSNIARVLDPATRSAKVRLELDNSGRIMRPNMFASVTFASRGGQTRPVVPATAILRLHDKSWVFRPEGGKRFRREEVQLGAVLPDGMQQVLSGLAPGDKVVAKALEFSSAAGAS